MKFKQRGLLTRTSDFIALLLLLLLLLLIIITIIITIFYLG